jgi:uncharacterized protein YkwD
MRRPLANRSRIALATAAIAAAAAFAAAPASAPAAARAAASCANADLVPNATNLGAVRQATLCLINGERRARGRRKLKSNNRLRTAAQRYVQEMVKKDFFGHVSPSGSTVLGRIKHAAYLSSARSWAVGENLAWGTGELSTPRQTVQNWMNSPPHRHNMLDKSFREIGIGVAVGVPKSSDGGATYATEFGTRS